MKKQYKLSEFQFYDGEELITFNLIAINTEKKDISVWICPKKITAFCTISNISTISALINMLRRGQKQIVRQSKNYTRNLHV